MQCPVGRVRVPMNVLPLIKSSQAEKPKKGIGSQVSAIQSDADPLFFFCCFVVVVFFGLGLKVIPDKDPSLPPQTVSLLPCLLKRLGASGVSFKSWDHL